MNEVTPSPARDLSSSASISAELLRARLEILRFEFALSPREELALDAFCFENHALPYSVFVSRNGLFAARHLIPRFLESEYFRK